MLGAMDGKKSKERYRAGAALDERTVNALYRTSLYTYGKISIFIRAGIGAVILLTILFVHMPVWASFPAMVLGCWLFVSYDFPARVQARSYLKKHTGKPESVRCTFLDDMMLSKDGEHSYSAIDRLIYDDNYLYVFFSRKDCFILEIASVVPHDTQSFKQWLAAKTGKSWDTPSLALLSHGERAEKRRRNRSL